MAPPSTSPSELDPGQAPWLLLLTAGARDHSKLRQALLSTGLGEEQLVTARAQLPLPAELLQEVDGRPDQPAVVILAAPEDPGRAPSMIRALRAHPATELVPVAVLVDEVDDPQVEACYEAGASSALALPEADQARRTLLASAVGYWLELNTGPPL